MVLTKQDGEWRIRAIHWSSIKRDLAFVNCVSCKWLFRPLEERAVSFINSIKSLTTLQR